MKKRPWVKSVIALAIVLIASSSYGETDSFGPIISTIAGAPTTGGNADGTGTDARFSLTTGITTDGVNLYVADTENHTIRKIVTSTGEVTTLAGTSGVSGFKDGAGATALFNYPQGIATDGTNLYVADTNNYGSSTN